MKKNRMLNAVLVSTLMIFITGAEALTFSQAKNELKKLYAQYPTEFYCGCSIDFPSPKKLTTNFLSCQYQPRKQPKRAARIEFEHIVPAWEFGHQRLCWQKGGREYCTANDPIFTQMEGDLHNLVPAVGEVNGDRSNYKYAMIEGEERVYGKCDAEVDFKARTFEPAPNIRGDIARTYRYFAYKYKLSISKKQQQLFNAWNNSDPVDAQECAIHAKKAAIQGDENPFVAQACEGIK